MQEFPHLQIPLKTAGIMCSENFLENIAEISSIGHQLRI
jgi:hypothetical protein